MNTNPCVAQLIFSVSFYYYNIYLNRVAGDVLPFLKLIYRLPVNSGQKYLENSDKMWNVYST